MEQQRILVTPHERGFIAVSHRPSVSALGSSAAEATEKVRLAIAARLERPDQSDLVVCFQQGGCRMIAMQPANEPFPFKARRERGPSLRGRA
jgi:hypothetical protein